MIGLELMWWAGWGWFAAWGLLPLLLVRVLGMPAGLLAWTMLVPWSTLAGLIIVHRLLPAPITGSWRSTGEPGHISWALHLWAPSLWLAVFQNSCGTSNAFLRVALRGFGAQIGTGSVVSSRTIIREPHLVVIGRDTLVGEFAHLICSFQPCLGTLIVDRITIGDRVLIGAHCHLGAGAVVGSDTLLEYAVAVGPASIVGANCRIGSGTSLYGQVVVGDGARIGKRCLIAAGSVIPPGAVIPDASVIAPSRVTTKAVAA